MESSQNLLIFLDLSLLLLIALQIDSMLVELFMGLTISKSENIKSITLFLLIFYMLFSSFYLSYFIDDMVGHEQRKYMPNFLGVIRLILALTHRKMQQNYIPLSIIFLLAKIYLAN